jgi:rare lipoprotein A
LSSETRPPQRNARCANNTPGSFALRFLLALAPALILAACGSAPKRVERTAVERDSDVTAPTPPPAASAPSASRGGYYQDDGPGDNPPANLDQIGDAVPRLEPLNRAANNPYTVFGQQYVPYKALTSYRQRGVGSWYGRKFHGQRTSGGEPYDMYAMTAAHATLPIPSYARVTNLANGHSVIVRVNDRGPFHSGRLIDLSYTAAYRLGYAGAGSASVEVESITREDLPMLAAQRRQAAQTEAAAPPQSNAVQPLAEMKPLDAVILASAGPLPPELAAPAPPIPVDAEAGGIYLQLGAFSGRDNAENFRIRVYQQLAWLNDAIQIFPRGGMFRLHLGPYRNRDEASMMAEKIREALQFKPVVVVR